MPAAPSHVSVRRVLSQAEACAAKSSIRLPDASVEPRRPRSRLYGRALAHAVRWQLGRDRPCDDDVIATDSECSSCGGQTDERVRLAAVHGLTAAAQARYSRAAWLRVPSRSSRRRDKIVAVEAQGRASACCGRPIGLLASGGRLDRRVARRPRRPRQRPRRGIQVRRRSQSGAGPAPHARRARPTAGDGWLRQGDVRSRRPAHRHADSSPAALMLHSLVDTPRDPLRGCRTCTHA